MQSTLEGYRSIRSVSVRFHLGVETVLMCLRAYYDGSGNSRSSHLTLAGYAGSADAWAEMESQWHAVLLRFNIPYFHWKEARSGHGAYAEWTEERLRDLFAGLATVLGRLPRDSMFGTSCTVDLQAYAEAKKVIPRLRHPAHICIDHCVGSTLGELTPEQKLELVFDRGENFGRIMKDLRRRRPWWSGRVVSLDEVQDMRCVAGIQAADLLAWLANRYVTKGENDPWGALMAPMLIVRPTLHAYFDKSAIASVFDMDGRMVPDAAMPTVPIRCASGTVLRRKRTQNRRKEDA